VEAVSIIIDDQMCQFCGLLCPVTRLEDLFEQWSKS